MPRSRTIPGSIYLPKGRSKLVIEYQGKKVHTGLEDTKEGRKLAQQMLEKMFLESKGLVKEEKKAILTYNEAFQQFLQFRCSNKSKKTQESYIYSFKVMFPENKNLTVENINTDAYRYIQATKHGNTSINIVLRSVQVFLRFCSDEKLIAEPIHLQKRFGKRVDITVQVYEQKECDAIIDYFRLHEPELAIMIQFMLLTGARLVDCLTLQKTDIGDGYVTFRNKISKKPEPTPVFPQAIELLRQLPVRDKVFRWTTAGSSFLHKRLRQAFKQCGILPNGRAYQEFRTTFRNKLLDSGIAPEIAMKLMRHSDIRITLQHYTRITDESMKNALEKTLNP
jgi:integrase